MLESKGMSEWTEGSPRAQQAKGLEFVLSWKLLLLKKNNNNNNNEFKLTQLSGLPD